MTKDEFMKYREQALTNLRLQQQFLEDADFAWESYQQALAGFAEVDAGNYINLDELRRAVENHDH